MKWWEIPQNCNCLFSLDSESVVESNGSLIQFSNPSNNYLNTENGVTGKVYSQVSSGFLSKNFITDFKNYKTYKSLKLNNINLFFNSSINTTSTSTWFLKCKVLGKNVLSQGPDENTHGLTWDPTINGDVSTRNWRARSINTSKGTTLQERSAISDETLHTVMVVTDVNQNFVKFYTEYGTFTEPYESDYFIKYFGSIHNVTRIGYVGTEWKPKIEIIAYGLFDKVLTKEEFDLINLNIEESFLLKESVLKFKTNLNFNYERYNYDTALLKPKNFGESNFLQGSEPVDGSKTFINKVKINSDVIVRQTLYKDFENIYDKVLEEGLPVEVKLFLYERNTGVLIKTTFSDIEGNFSFLNLNKDLEYFVTANDNKYQFQSVLKNYNN